MKRTKNIGFENDTPSQDCKDTNCPYHGNLKVRGKKFMGQVVSDKMQHSVIVEWTGWRQVPKYERYKKTKTRLTAHNPICIDAKEGDLVMIGECRPISKTKNFVVIKVLGKAGQYQLQKEALQKGKHKIKKKEAANKEAEEHSSEDAAEKQAPLKKEKDDAAEMPEVPDVTEATDEE